MAEYERDESCWLKEGNMLCCRALGVSQPIPCSQLLQDVSLEPTWRTAAGCAVLPAWNKSCLSLGDPSRDRG